MAYAADQTKLSTQSNARTGPIVRFIWHHQAGTNDDGTIGAMVSGSRQVSATWTVSNTGRITSVVPEDRRPWTSASYADDGALTVECANITGPPDYGISDASHEACARLAAYAYRAHGVPLQRATAANGWRGHMGHNEVVGAFGDGYATACPLHLDIDRILALATDSGSIDGGAALEPTTPAEEDDVTPEDIAKIVADVTTSVTAAVNDNTNKAVAYARDALKLLISDDAEDAPMRRDVDTGGVFARRSDGWIHLTQKDIDNLGDDFSATWKDANPEQIGMRLKLFGFIGRASEPDVTKQIEQSYGVTAVKVV